MAWRSHVLSLPYSSVEHQTTCLGTAACHAPANHQSAFACGLGTPRRYNTPTAMRRTCTSRWPGPAAKRTLAASAGRVTIRHKSHIPSQGRTKPAAARAVPAGSPC